MSNKNVVSNLMPNTTYYGPNQAEYHTDEYGRVASWSGWVSAESAPRDVYAQRTLPGKNSDQSHAGHLMASSNGGSGKQFNQVPMNDKVNTRDYRGFEKENTALAKEGYDVKLTGYNSYLARSPVDGSRVITNVPDALMVTQEVYKDGTLVDTQYFSWTNLDMAEFDDIPPEVAEFMEQYERDLQNMNLSENPMSENPIEVDPATGKVTELNQPQMNNSQELGSGLNTGNDLQTQLNPMEENPIQIDPVTGQVYELQGNEPGLNNDNVPSPEPMSAPGPGLESEIGNLTPADEMGGPTEVDIVNDVTTGPEEGIGSSSEGPSNDDGPSLGDGMSLF